MQVWFVAERLVDSPLVYADGQAANPDFSLVTERAGAMSSKYSICILFEDLALEKQTVFFKQRLFSL